MEGDVLAEEADGEGEACDAAAADGDAEGGSGVGHGRAERRYDMEEERGGVGGGIGRRGVEEGHCGGDVVRQSAGPAVGPVVALLAAGKLPRNDSKCV